MGKSPQTAFQKIAYFNTLIGNSNATDLSGLKAQFHCIKEEFLEMEHALNEYIEAVQRCEEGGNDGGDVAQATDLFIELRDGIADVLVTTYGLAHRAGIDADWDLELVYESNMSKFIKTDDINMVDAAAVDIQNRLGMAVCFNETAPGIWAITSAKGQHGRDGKFYPLGKLLKPSTFKEPDFNKTEQLQSHWVVKLSDNGKGEAVAAGIGISDPYTLIVGFIDEMGRRCEIRYHKNGICEHWVDRKQICTTGPI